MLNKLNTPPADLLADAVANIPMIDTKISINQPTGNFFYNKWEIKSEFTNTVWEEILNSLNVDEIGEARIIKIDIESCYTKHADIDNRWHFPLVSNDGYLIDIKNKTMYELDAGCWYYMDAGRPHSAVNFGCDARVHLVVRSLLNKGNITNPKKVRITTPDVYNARYLFDCHYSPLLNTLDKNYMIDKFNVIDSTTVEFYVDSTTLIPHYKGFIINEQE